MVSSRKRKAEEAKELSSRAKKRPGPTARQQRESNLPTIGGHDCWCGKKLGHGWRGKADGKPHPRARRRR